MRKPQCLRVKQPALTMPSLEEELSVPARQTPVQTVQSTCRPASG